MRFPNLLPVVVLAACTTQDVGPDSDTARFSDYPTQLFEAFESACSEPSQNFVRHSPDLIECREYLPPRETAAIILSYDGTPEKLPQIVFRFRTSRDANSYLVRNDVYLDVPQKSGVSRQVAQRDRRFTRMMSELYRRTGGVPE